MVPLARPSLSPQDFVTVTKALLGNELSGNSWPIQMAEEALSRLTGGYATVTSNGTVSLELILRANGIGPGDEVIIPSLTYAACANAFISVGAKPVFCDVEEETWLASLNSIKGVTSDTTRGIIVTDLYGVSPSWDQVRKFARTSGFVFIRDSAEAISNKFSVREGEIVSFSFFANKIVTSGEGGAIVTRDQELDRKIRLLRGLPSCPPLGLKLFYCG